MTARVTVNEVRAALLLWDAGHINFAEFLAKVRHAVGATPTDGIKVGSDCRGLAPKDDDTY